ncbi:hypothetical protein CSC81_10230 [Tenacibaculum discolor]|uniref:Uncharacterized protein n=1 Tax=Tenacibaculum discolor TaxID=361581 RepID=A0A2G1BTR4_9FLAO|nr:hypothetical protein [Tenacibaculum discolor]MDP2541543.1 hypothetical protein [Tenacibaculum discolor]PHN97443.1 hypothetical protein CSC81_10230 [Tenacibaculum discolor]
MERNYHVNHTNCVDTVINSIETVLKKNRKSLMNEDIRLLEESLHKLNLIKQSNNSQTKFSAKDLVSLGHLVIELMQLFEINIP